MAPLLKSVLAKKLSDNSLELAERLGQLQNLYLPMIKILVMLSMELKMTVDMLPKIVLKKCLFKKLI